MKYSFEQNKRREKIRIGCNHGFFSLKLVGNVEFITEKRIFNQLMLCKVNITSFFYSKDMISQTDVKEKKLYYALPNNCTLL